MTTTTTTNTTPEDLKAEADTLFRAKSYVDAIDQYSKVLDLDEAETEAVLKARCFSNRAACREKLVPNSYGTDKTELIRRGLADGRACIERDPTFVRGCQRLVTFLLFSHEEERTTATTHNWKNDDDADYDSSDDDENHNNNDDDEKANRAAENDDMAAEKKVDNASSSSSSLVRLTAVRREIETVARGGLALDVAQPNDTLLEALQVLRDAPTHENFRLNPDLAPTDTTLSLADGAGQRAQAYKTKGGHAFAAKQWEAAEQWYTKALACDPVSIAVVVDSSTNRVNDEKEGNTTTATANSLRPMPAGGHTAVLYSNRSATRAAQEKFAVALRDAERCVQLRPTWSKGHSRRATALFGLGRYAEAEASCQAGLVLEPTNPPLLEMLATCQQETCEPLAVQREMFRLREQEKKDAKLQEMIAKLSGGGGGPKVFNMNGMDFSGGGNPFANLGNGMGGGGLEGLFGGGGGQAKKPKLSDGQLRSMARATVAAATTKGATAAATGSTQGCAKLEEEEVLTDDDDDDEGVGVKSVIE